MENRFKSTDNVLLVTNKDLVFEKTFVDEMIEKVGKQNVINITIEDLTNNLSLKESFFDTILSCVQQIDDKVLSILLLLLKPNSNLIIKKSKDCTSGETVSSLKLNGFVNINETIDEIVAQKPNYTIGSSVKLKQNEDKSKTAKIWSLAADDMMDDTVELINDEDLLSPEDKLKPNPDSKKVCATTKQRKACADCSCGLAEELEQEVIDNIKKNTQNAKSSCGSCYLGDAFRCAKCPYLGMPAFKPGEKVLLDNSSDI